MAPTLNKRARRMRITERLHSRGVALFVCLLVLGCKTPPAEGPGASNVPTFQTSGPNGESYEVKLLATPKVPMHLLALLQRELRIESATQSDREQEFWSATRASLSTDRAEVRVDVALPASLVYTWPDAFRAVRPGVLEVVPQYATLPAPPDGVDVVRHALEASQSIRGRLLCGTKELAHLQVVAGNRSAVSRADGTFEIAGPFDDTPTQVYVAYKGELTSPLIPTFHPGLEIMDDFHVTRSWNVDKTPSISGGIADFGDLALDGNDCELWLMQIRALVHYFSVENTAPPAGGFRIKHWTAIDSSLGTAHTFYNYIILPTDYGAGRERTVFHEFGHTLRFVADGSETHWHWDDLRFNYGHSHGDDLFNKGFSFSEGWAHFWSAMVRGDGHSPDPKTHASNTDADLDWDEDRIGERLVDMADKAGGRPAGAKLMMDLVLANPGTFHTLYEFERAYCKALPSGTNKYCANHQPLRVHPPSCPPAYTDDGATCRFNNVRAKPSSGRGVGTVPSSCGAGMEYDAGLCYPTCPAGYRGVATLCYQNCPAGYRDDGATCHRDAKIVNANTDACPAGDKCGLFHACSVCPAGYHNDGCTCRIDVHTFWKATTDRGVGKVPNGCATNLEYDAGLCYPRCPAGFHGVGPRCWGTCPLGFRDDGATCYMDPHIFSDDPDN